MMHKPKPPLEPVVQLDYEGRHYTFRVDPNPPLAFWRVESGERVYRSPFRVSGTEQPDFFRNVIRSAIQHGDL